MCDWHTPITLFAHKMFCDEMYKRITINTAIKCDWEWVAKMAKNDNLFRRLLNGFLVVMGNPNVYVLCVVSSDVDG